MAGNVSEDLPGRGREVFLARGVFRNSGQLVDAGNDVMEVKAHEFMRGVFVVALLVVVSVHLRLLAGDTGLLSGFVSIGYTSGVLRFYR